MFKSKSKFLPFFMWFFPLSFFTYQFILRLWPGLMMHQIMEQFSIDASRFGVLAALYYYGYSGMQIPVAIMLERFKVRYVVFAFSLLCGLATLLFSYTNNWYLAGLSRFLVGAGSAVGFLAVSKVISQWFPKSKYAKMVGFSFTLGLLGAIYGGKPVSLLVANYPWQNVALILALIAMLLGVGSYYFLRSPQQNNTKTDEPTTSFKASYFRTLLSSPTIWILAVANLLMVGSLEGFADVWGVSYLTTAFELDKSNAAQLVSFIFVGMLFGGPLLAFLSKYLGNYTVIAFCGVGMAFVFKLLLSTTTYNWYWLAALFFLIGLMCCYQVIVFAAGSDLVETKLLGVTIAFLNCINMLGGSFFHTLIGKAMDATWGGALSEEGLRIYALESYKTALLLIPGCAVVGSCLVGLIGFNLHRRQAHSLQA
ncbi:MFS transporter [Legionella hackeliae]|uniref:Major facilitator family transporter n=1 Tax=Legionella hackeliae TaxID=449 RepID=A0A0A8UQG4_LEGHA|nr:MFS transporter [Legionella hackeliae]KTD09693.1 major facilitator family transporter [Legionella hackeliae]CEK10983.1 Major facilitator family transporter [Legionella hackeliae]STX47723.1 major facilitator family transporter [Legionella hackeliae]